MFGFRHSRARAFRDGSSVLGVSWKIEEEATITSDPNDVILFLGVPVICNGLQKAKHLNGKIGDVHRFDEDVERYEIHFEDASLKPCLVKPENVRILFDLPTKE